jgi:hypothetical protein
MHQLHIAHLTVDHEVAPLHVDSREAALPIAVQQ